MSSFSAVRDGRPHRFGPGFGFSSALGTRYCFAAPFEQHGISPAVAQLADAFAASDFAKATGFVEANAGFVLRENTRLQRPEAVVLRLPDQFFEQRPAHAQPSRLLGDVDRDLSHASVDAAAGDRA